MRRSIVLAGALAAALAGWVERAGAGPVPGVETFDKRPVEFKVPPSLTIWDIGNDEYLVTFRWKPSSAVEKPGVAGTFNNWDRKDLPMEGPDAEGAYSVTARMKSGDHRYKFVSGADGWHTDEGNPGRESDGHEGFNSILRLGIFAIAADVTPARGDRRILKDALKHEPSEALFFDVYTGRDATLRTRALKGDVSSATVTIEREDGTRDEEPMVLVASDPMFDYFEYNYHRAGDGKKAPGRTYSFTFADGSGPEATAGLGPFPMRFDPAGRVRVPEWAKHVVWYQIFPDRFRDGTKANNIEKRNQEEMIDQPPQTHRWRSEWYAEYPYERQGGQSFWKWSMYNRMYGGDLQGVIEKLDYVKSLGATAIYLNPVFEAQGSHKYNARNYVHIDDGFGVLGQYWPAAAREDLKDPATWEWTKSDEVFLELLREAKKRDMRVIIDGVFNHVGAQHAAFLDVQKNGQKSRYADWFSIESWEPFKYRGWAGFDGLPEFRKVNGKDMASESAKKHVFDVTRRWMDPNGDGDPSDGIDGWRLDVPGELSKGFWQEWRVLVKSINPEAYISGEVWDPAEYWLDGTTFDAVMNYQFAQIAFRYFANETKKTSATQFDQELARLRIRYPREHTLVLQNLYDSHDTDRWVSRIVNPDMPYDGGNRIQDGNPRYHDQRPDDAAYRRLRLMALFQATYLGAPMIWYGTEVGMFGADDPRCRMPMWWDDKMPYDNPAYRIDSALRDEFRALFGMRNTNDVLRMGDFTTLVTADAQDVYGYLRSSPERDHAIAVVLNNSASEQTVEIAAPRTSILPQQFSDVAVLHGTAKVERAEGGARLKVTLPPVSGVAIKVKASHER